MSEVVEPQPDDDLVFAAHDLGRDRPALPAAEEHGFAVAPRTALPAAGAGTEGFVRGGRDAAPSLPPRGSAPAAPVAPPVDGAPATPAPAPAHPSAGVAGTHAKPSFRVTTAAVPVAGPGADPPWLLREPVPVPASPGARRGWAMRHSSQMDGSVEAALVRLREEAVDVSWQAAWVAVSSADRRLQRKRAG